MEATITLKTLHYQSISFFRWILKVHYQLAFTYEPVHLSLYVAQQRAGFMRTHSQMSLKSTVRFTSSTSLLTSTSIGVACSFSPSVKQTIRKCQVTLTEAYFLHTQTQPPKTPSSFGYAASCEQMSGRPLQELSTATTKTQRSFHTF